MVKGQLLIDNIWKDSESGQNIDIISPWDKSVVGSVAAATAGEVNWAVENADKAFWSWRNTMIGERAELFTKAAGSLRSHSEELTELLHHEIGKTKESAAEEISRSIDFIELTAGAMKHMKGTVYNGDVTGKYGSGRKTGIYNRVPLGVIVAIAPFNYPINLSITKIAPALISGNTVVFKPPTQGSLTALAFYRYFNEAGLPAGVLNIITGKSGEIGDPLVTHKLTKLVAFTGSTGVGKHIGEVTKGIPLLMELGGKDTAIVTNKADLDLAAREIVSGAFSYCGQRCTAQKLVLVYNEVADQFAEKVKELASKLELNPMIDDGSADYVMELIGEATVKGAAHILNGERTNGNYIKPNILDHVNETMRIFHEEQFGPVMPIVRAGSEEDAVAKLNSLQYGLQASVYTNDIEEAFRIADKLEVGTVQINGRPDRGPDNFPFGGVKDSGQFMQGTIETIELMTRGKLTVLNLQKHT